jgi:hypothetical protein
MIIVCGKEKAQQCPQKRQWLQTYSHCCEYDQLWMMPVRQGSFLIRRGRASSQYKVLSNIGEALLPTRAFCSREQDSPMSSHCYVLKHCRQRSWRLMCLHGRSRSGRYALLSCAWRSLTTGSRCNAKGSKICPKLTLRSKGMNECWLIYCLADLANERSCGGCIRSLSQQPPGRTRGCTNSFHHQFDRDLAEIGHYCSSLYKFITTVTIITTVWPLHPNLLGFCIKRASQQYGLALPT